MIHLNKYIAIINVILLLSYSCSNSEINASLKSVNTKQIDTIIYIIGEQKVFFIIYNSSDTTGIIYFNMHDDENTSVDATKFIIDKYFGKFIELKAQGKRLIDVQIEKKVYSFDPNRIYTDLGIEKTLKKNGNYSQKAFDDIKLLSQFIISNLLNKAKIIIAVHNNSNGYSVNNYKKEAIYCSDAEDLSINDNKDPNDFFFVIDSVLFNFLKLNKFNTVLQNNINVTDDGSLSVFSAKYDIPYINVEAQNGHLKEQIEMLELIQKPMLTHNWLLK